LPAKSALHPIPIRLPPIRENLFSASLSADGPHLHASVADEAGLVCGGHVMLGCTVRTTAEIVLALLPGWEFARQDDAATGFKELVPRSVARGLFLQTKMACSPLVTSVSSY